MEGEELCDEGGKGRSIQSDEVDVKERFKKGVNLLHVTMFSPVLGSTIETCGHSVIG